MSLMLKNIDIDKLRDLCDDLGLSTRLDGDKLVLTLSPDEDFDRTVAIFFTIDRNRLAIFAMASKVAEGLDPKDAIRLCNEWNAQKKQPKAVFEPTLGDFLPQIDYYLDEALSEEYFKTNVIKASSAFIWSFFVEIGKKVKELQS